jgi:hypothetical protein
VERIERVIRSSRRRLALGVFAAASARAALVLAAAFLLAAAAARVFSLGLPLGRIAAGLALAAPLFGALAAIARRPSRLRTAAEVDRRLALGERVSSALLLGPAPGLPVEAAVVASALERLEGVDVRRAFPIGLPRDLPRAAVVVAVGALVAVFLPELGLLRESKAATDPQKHAESERAKEDAKKIESVRHRIETQTRGKDLPEVAQALQEMQEAARRLETDAQDRKQELAKLSSLEDKLKERARSLPSLDRLGQQMKDMAPQERTRDLERALASMAADKAEQALKKLAQEAVDAAKAGDAKKLEDLSKELEKLAKAADAVPGLKDALEKLAKATGEKAQGKGEQAGLEAAAKDAVAEGSEALEDAAKADEEAELLAKAADGVGAAKEGLQALEQCPDCQGVCPKCRAAGCDACGTPECKFAGKDPDHPDAEEETCLCPGGT